MRWLAARLERAGFSPEQFTYPTIAGGPEAALPRLVDTLARAPAHVLAHSLGGLVALTCLQREPGLRVSRVVCLGSPLCGSAAATGMSGQSFTAAALGRSASLLREGCQPWHGRAEVGVVAGRLRLGLGQFFGSVRGDSDGTVAVAETQLAGLTDHVVVGASHSGLLFSTDAARQTIEFLRKGSFRH